MWKQTYFVTQGHKEAMKTLLSSQIPPPKLPKPVSSPSQPKGSPVLPNQNANTLKGFGGRRTPPQRVNTNYAEKIKQSRGRGIESSSSSSSSTGKTGKDDEEEIPDEVFYRIIYRILISVGVPLGLGIALLYVFGEIKERNLLDIPTWIPFTATLLTFGASTLGIAYGALSASLDPQQKGSLLGFEQLERNWTNMWSEEDGEDKKRL